MSHITWCLWGWWRAALSQPQPDRRNAFDWPFLAPTFSSPPSCISTGTLIGSRCRFISFQTRPRSQQHITRRVFFDQSKLSLSKATPCSNDIELRVPCLKNFSSEPTFSREQYQVATHNCRGVFSLVNRWAGNKIFNQEIGPF